VRSLSSSCLLQNNHLAELLESEGAEAVVPDLIDFMCYCFYNQNFKVENLGFKKSKATMANWGIKAIEWVRKPASEALAQSRHFAPPADIRDLAKNGISDRFHRKPDR